LKFTDHPIVQLRKRRQNKQNYTDSNKHVELKIAQKSNTRQRKTQPQRKRVSSPTKQQRNLQKKKRKKKKHSYTT